MHALLNELRSRVSGDEQLFFKMAKVLIAFQSTPANSASDVPFTPDHIADLCEFLVPYAYQWRPLGTGLKFKPQDLSNIEAMCGQSVQASTLKLIEDWILKKHVHSLPPTADNLDRVLKSQLVGLGSVASELRGYIARNRHLSMQNQALPYFLGSVEITRIYNACDEDYVRDEDFEDFESDTYMQTPNIEAEEDKAVLLEAQVEVPYDDCVKVEYQWLLNGNEIQEGLNHTGVTMPVLCVRNADIGMDGSKYSCEIVADISEYDECEYTRATKVTAFDITLTVKMLSRSIYS